MLNPVLTTNAETSNFFTNSRLGDISKIKELYSSDWNFLNRIPKFEFTYNGNPDLQPVRTYEIATLVSFFNEFAQQLNEKVIFLLDKIDFI